MRSTLPAVSSKFMDSNEVVRLIEEQRPDFTLPCPHCYRPVDGGGRVLVEGFKPRLPAHCGESGYEFTGRGCFAKIAWDPDQRAWVPY